MHHRRPDRQAIGYQIAAYRAGLSAAASIALNLIMVGASPRPSSLARLLSITSQAAGRAIAEARRIAEDPDAVASLHRAAARSSEFIEMIEAGGMPR